jgi:hypothetical protein
MDKGRLPRNIDGAAVPKGGASALLPVAPKCHYPNLLLCAKHAVPIPFDTSLAVTGSVKDASRLSGALHIWRLCSSQLAPH